MATPEEQLAIWRAARAQAQGQPEPLPTMVDPEPVVEASPESVAETNRLLDEWRASREASAPRLEAPSTGLTPSYHVPGVTTMETATGQRVRKAIEYVEEVAPRHVRPIVDFARGAAIGVTEAPIVQPLVTLARHAGVLGEEFDAAVALNARNNKTTSFGKLVGTLAPEMVAWQTGSMLGEMALSKALTTVGVNTMRVAAPVLKRMGTQAQAVERWYASLADPLAADVVKPGLVRGTEIVGRSIGAGGVGAAEAPFQPSERGEPPPDALSGGLTYGLANLAFESVLTGGAKLAFAGAKEVSKQAIVQRFIGSPTQAELQGIESRFRSRLIGAVNAVRTAFHEEQQAQTVATMYQQLPSVVPAPPQAFLTGQQAAFSALGRATATRIDAMQKMHEAKGNLAVARLYSNVGERDILAGQYLSEHPTNFEGLRGAARRLVRERFGTADGVRKELGVVGEYAIRQIDNAQIRTWTRTQGSHEILNKYFGTALEKLRGNKSLLRESMFTWEKHGSPAALTELQAAGISVDDARHVVNTFDEIGRGMGQLHKIAVEMGAEPELDLAAMRVANYLPHILREGVRDTEQAQTAMVNYLVKQGMPKTAATQRVLDLMNQKRARSFERFGSTDERRLIPSGYKSKLENGIPLVEDPVEAVYRYYGGMHNRIAMSQVLGWKGELKNELVSAVSTESGINGAALFRETVDSIAGYKYHSEIGQAIASSVTNLQSAAKLGMAWSPNLWQTALNNPVVFGMRNTLSGLRTMVFSEPPSALKTAAGFMANDFFDLGVRENFLQAQRQGITSRLARFVLNRATPFSFEERYHRMGAAMGAHASLTNILQKAHVGRLKGERLAFSRRLFNEAGLDLGTVLREGITPDEYMTAAVRLMRRSQFGAIGEAGRVLRPNKWMTPTGRVVTQFSNYSLNQGRLMRDYTLNEIAKGNYRQLHRFLGFYLPTADVATTVHYQIMNAMSGQKRERTYDPTLRLVEDMLFVGSLGMVNTLFYALRFGDAAKLAGPTSGDVQQAVESFHDNKIGGLMRMAARQPTARLFTAIGNVLYQGGKAAKDAAEEYQAAWDAEGGTGEEAAEGSFEDFKQ